jgi:tRNA(Ile)-lysidine synthase
MSFFKKHARVVWLGHQQDDFAESMLMRLARGSGSGGLAAPRPVQLLPRGRVHLRPLLTVKKEALVDALRTVGAYWCEDATNKSIAYFRNRIRVSVLPAWSRAAQRDALAGAALARELLEEDDAALEARVDELRPLGRNKSLTLKAIAGQPRAIVRRALHRWLLAQSRAGALVRQGFEALLVAVEQGKPTRLSLGREGFAVIRGGVLGFERAEKRP